MYFLGRDQSPLKSEHWKVIDGIVLNTVKKILVGRRFLHLFGPLGPQIQTIFADVVEDAESKKAVRRYYPLKQIYEDFKLNWNDLEYILSGTGPYDFSQVARATLECAKKEDEFIFWGCKELELEGILTATGTNRLKKGNWNEGETAYSEIVKGIELLLRKGYIGKLVLVLSPDIYVQLSRINPMAGVLELERISKLVDDNIFKTPVLGEGRAVLICTEFSNIDLTVGQDMVVTYMGNDKLDHEFRIMETILLRIKNKDSIVIFE